MSYSIRFDNVSKRYRVGRSLPSLRQILGLGRAENPQSPHVHWAVRDVSWELAPSEALAIIGPNGAGKTTTLKLLSRVTQPTSGAIDIRGRYAALIELGAGFHPDLTGRENIFLNGAILGMKRGEIRRRFDQIVDFAGIEQYLDTPVKRYSSGMTARLGFAVAAHVDPDVLLIDEVLAVGDYAFRMKCYARMNELRERGASLIFVSHNMEDVRRVCDRGLVMYAGAKAFAGTAAEAVAEYANVLRQNASRSAKEANGAGGGLAQRRMTHEARITRVDLVGEDGHTRRAVISGEKVSLVVEFECYADVEQPVFACIMHGPNGELVYDTTTRVLGLTSPSYKAGQRGCITYELAAHLLDGSYTISTDLAYADLSCYYDFVANALTFSVVGGNRAKGVANLWANVEFLPPTPVEATVIDGDSHSIENGTQILQI